MTNESALEATNLTPTYNITQHTVSWPPVTYIYITVPIFYAIVFLFGVFGNVLVIYVVLTQKSMCTPTNIFLVNLSVADLLVLLVCMPSALVEFQAKEVWLLGTFMCKYHYEHCLPNGENFVS